MPEILPYLSLGHCSEGVNEGKFGVQIWHLVNKLATLLHHGCYSLQNDGVGNWKGEEEEEEREREGQEFNCNQDCSLSAMAGGTAMAKEAALNEVALCLDQETAPEKYS